MERIQVIFDLMLAIFRPETPPAYPRESSECQAHNLMI